MAAAAVGVSTLVVPAPLHAASRSETVCNRPDRSVVSPRNRAQVHVVGDSLTYGEWCLAGSNPSARDHWRSAGFSVAVSAKVGKHASGGPSTNPGGLAVLARWKREGARLRRVVFALGTNELLAGHSARSFAATLEHAITLAAPARIYLVTVFVADRPELSARYNARVYEAARNNPNVTVIEWGEQLLFNPGFLAGDGVHLSPRGYSRRAGYISSRIASCTLDEALLAESVRVCL